MSKINDQGKQKTEGMPDGHDRRQKKAGNSVLFNQLLSDANGLSVAERVRLVKSLAGQQGLMVSASTAVMQSADGVKPQNQKKKNSDQQVIVRPNPLKGTAFQKALDDAKAGVRSAKEDMGLAKLPDNHPAAINLIAALSNYKSEQTRLAPVGPPLIATTKSTNQQQSESSNKKKRPASKSPIRTGSGAIDAMRKAVGFSKDVKKSDDMDL